MIYTLVIVGVGLVAAYVYLNNFPLGDARTLRARLMDLSRAAIGLAILIVIMRLVRGHWF